jgi:chromosome segregation ATPase
MNKKLGLETKIRDAAVNLSKVNASYRKVTKQTSEQLEAAERKVENAQKEVWRVSERLNEVNRRLYEHRVGVLSFSVRTMEKKLAPQSNGTSETTTDGRDSRSSVMSPTLSSVTSVSNTSKSRFDGAHLFAGHADAVVPQLPRAPPTLADVIALEEQLKAATQQLSSASQKQAEMGRELSMLRLEKEQMETSMGMELQNAEETIDRLEKELDSAGGTDSQVQKLLQQQDIWEQDRAELERKTREVDVLERRLEVLEEQSGEASELGSALARARQENDRMKQQWGEDRTAWQKERDKAVADSALLGEELRRLKTELQHAQGQGQGDALEKANAHIDECSDKLRSLVKTHGIVLSSGDFSSLGIISSIGDHLEAISGKLDTHARSQAEWDDVRRKFQEDIQSGFDKREALAREIEQARQEREEARREARELELRLRVTAYYR